MSNHKMLFPRLVGFILLLVVASADQGSGITLPVNAIHGISVGLVVLIVMALAFLWWKVYFRHKTSLQNDLKGLEIQTGRFTLKQIKIATKNFDPLNKIGEGGFGPVYKGILSDGTLIAVKQLSAMSKQGNREFITELGMISAVQHPHLVKLHGCCIEGNQLLLIYEYLENNSLARALFGPKEKRVHLDWPTRHKISIGIAKGLAYLHEESTLKIVHRDIKATNVLLDENFNPKISDFGLAKLDEEDSTHISTRVAGTYGYMAPEYAMKGHLTDKADVYSFGVVLLEVICGISNSSLKTKEECIDLLDWANSLKETGEFLNLVDPRLESNFNPSEVISSIQIALLCTTALAAERPSMSTVVSMLEGRISVREYFSETNSNRSTGKISNRIEMLSVNQGKSISIDVPWTGSSSTSTADLFPLDSAYWEKRDSRHLLS